MRQFLKKYPWLYYLLASMLLGLQSYSLFYFAVPDLDPYDPACNAGFLMTCGFFVFFQVCYYLFLMIKSVIAMIRQRKKKDQSSNVSK